MDKPTGRQLAAARTLLGLTQADVAARSNLSVPTLKRMEASEGPVAGMQNNIDAVIRALEEAGVIFQGEGEAVGGGRGVRLRTLDYDAIKDAEWSSWRVARNEAEAIRKIRLAWPPYAPQGDGKGNNWSACDREQMIKVGETRLNQGQWEYRTKELKLKV